MRNVGVTSAALLDAGLLAIVHQMPAMTTAATIMAVDSHNLLSPDFFGETLRPAGVFDLVIAGFLVDFEARLPGIM